MFLSFNTNYHSVKPLQLKQAQTSTYVLGWNFLLDL